MIRLSVRNVRLKWPEAERKLASGEIAIARDAKPVARLLPYGTEHRRNPARFDPATHVRWLRGFWRRERAGIPTETLLDQDRSD